MTKLKFIALSVFFYISNSVVSQDTIQQKINNYLSRAQFDSAKTYIRTNLAQIPQAQNKRGLNYQLVKVLFMQSEYNEALKQAFSSLDHIEEEEKRVNFNFMIGCIYSAITDYSKSVEYFDLVVEHSQDSSLTVQTHLLLSQLHLDLGDSTNAGKSLEKAYNISSFSKLNSRVKNHVAMQYNFYNKNYELCKQQNLNIIKDSTIFLNTRSYALSMVGDCLVKQDSLIEAASYFDEFLKLTVETKDPEQIKVAAKKLIEVYEALGIQEKANAYHKIYNEAVSDSLNFSIEKYRDLFNVEKNRELNVAKTKNFRKYLYIGLCVCLILSFGVYLYIKNKKKEALLKLEKASGKKIVVSDIEIEKIAEAIDQLVVKQLYLTPSITRKSFCEESEIKSERYLSHYINEKYNKSFSVFINELRIEYAFNRIHNDSKFRNYKIEEIAKECGFGSKKSFERVFLAKYNKTPYKLILSLLH